MVHTVLKPTLTARNPRVAATFMVSGFLFRLAAWFCSIVSVGRWFLILLCVDFIYFIFSTGL